MLFTMPIQFGAATAVKPLSQYVAVDYSTLKARSKQLYEYRGDWQWEFVQSVVACESGFSYKVKNKSSAAMGLFGLMPVACRDVGVNYEEAKTSVLLQLRAGRKVMAISRREINKVAPSLIQAPGYDLYAIGYHSHNVGPYGTAQILRAVVKAGLDPTWANFKVMAKKYPKLYNAAKIAKSEECAALVPRWRARLAELVTGDKNAVTAGADDTEPVDEGATAVETTEELEAETQPGPYHVAEDNGVDIEGPASLDDYPRVPGPGSGDEEGVAGMSTAAKWFLGLAVTAAVGAVAYVLVREYRPKWLRKFA